MSSFLSILILRVLDVFPIEVCLKTPLYIHIVNNSTHLTKECKVANCLFHFAIPTTVNKVILVVEDSKNSSLFQLPITMQLGVYTHSIGVITPTPYGRITKRCSDVETSCTSFFRHDILAYLAFAYLAFQLLNCIFTKISVSKVRDSRFKDKLPDKNRRIQEKHKQFLKQFQKEPVTDLLEDLITDKKNVGPDFDITN